LSPVTACNLTLSPKQKLVALKAVI